MEAVVAPVDGPEEPQGRLRRSRGVLTTIVVTTFAFWLILALALWIYTADARRPTTHTLVIPDGSIELIASGENPLKIPSNWSFLADDTLVIVNEDRVDHWLGDFWVAAGTTQAFDLQPDFGGSWLCTLHPSGAITIDVGVRDFDWRLTALPTLTIGPFVGLILAGTGRVMNALDEPDRRGKDSPSS